MGRGFKEMNVRSWLCFFGTWFFIAIGYVYFYFPFKDSVYHGDSYNYLLQAKHGAVGFFPSLIRLLDYNHLHVCLFLLACLFITCWLFFKTLLGSDFFAMVGCVLVFFDPYLYQAIHLGIIDNVHLLLAFFLMILLHSYYFKKLWWGGPIWIGLSMYVWGKSFNFLWKFPEVFTNYLMLKGFYIQELMGLTNIQLLLGGCGFILCFVVLYIKRKFFWYFLLLLYLAIFILSIVMRRFYLFLIPLQVLAVLILLSDSKFFDVGWLSIQFRKFLMIALVLLILGIKMNFFILSPPMMSSSLILDLNELNEGVYVSNWHNGNYIWYYSNIEPLMHHSPDYIKTPLFADSMMTCNKNTSLKLLKEITSHLPLETPRFIILFPQDIEKNRGLEAISEYKLLPCSRFYSFFKSNTSISITKI